MATKKHFFSFITYNFGTKVVAVIVSIFIWLIVINSRKTDQIKYVPLKIIEPDDLVVGTPVPRQIEFRLLGPRAFMGPLMKREEKPIEINLSQAKQGTHNHYFSTDRLEVPLGVKVVSVYPKSLVVSLEKKRRRRVPIRLDLQGQLPDGFEIVSSEITPNYTYIRGSRNQIGRISEVFTRPLELSGLKHSLQQELEFVTIDDGVEAEATSVRSVVIIRPTAANFRLKNVPVKVKSDLNFNLKNRTVTVYVLADKEDTVGLDGKVSAEIDLTGKVKGSYNSKITVTIPENIGLFKVVPDMTNVTLY